MNEKLKANNAVVVGTYWWRDSSGIFSNMEKVDEIFSMFKWPDDMLRFTDLDGSFRVAIKGAGPVTPNEFVISTKTMTVYAIEPPLDGHLDLLALTAELNQ